MNELLEFVKENRQAIADLTKVPPPIIEQSFFEEIDDHMYDVMSGGKIETWNGKFWVAGVRLASVEEIRGDDIEDGCYMDEEYMETTGLTPDIIKSYIEENDPHYVIVGEEFSSIFITDVNHPPLISNWMTWNDEYFFGCKVHDAGQAREYEVNGKKLYITWGIPDPGSG